MASGLPCPKNGRDAFWLQWKSQPCAMAGRGASSTSLGVRTHGKPLVEQNGATVTEWGHPGVGPPAQAHQPPETCCCWPPPPALGGCLLLSALGWASSWALQAPGPCPMAAGRHRGGRAPGLAPCTGRVHNASPSPPRGPTISRPHHPRENATCPFPHAREVQHNGGKK